MIATDESYRIELPGFEGPFDLLLFFIERDELDIYDIPISTITADFLAYIKQMESLNMDLASEFILVAASLMRIKAKMLIPRKELDEDGNEIDPREELVQKLLEYKKFKAVAEEMKSLEEQRFYMEKRGNSKFELKQISELFATEAELESLSLFKLMNAYQKALERFEHEKNKPQHKMIVYPFTMEETKENLRNKVKNGKKISFQSIFDECQSRMHCIFYFLSILEMVQERLLSLVNGEGVNSFWIAKGDNYA